MTKAEKKAAKAAEKKGGEKGSDKADKKEKAPKQEKAPEKKPDDAVLEKKKREKLIAKVEKEGGKKGVEVEGAADLGGLAFFCTYVMEPDGDMDLLEMCFAAMNAEPDPTAEERRGGASGVGKIVFSAGQRQLSLVCNVPYDKTTDTPNSDPEKPPMMAMHAAEWVQGVLEPFKDEIKGNVSVWPLSTSEFAKASVELNDEDIAAGTATIRLKDEMMKRAYQILNEKNCFEDDGNDGESDVIYHFEGEGDDY